LKRKKQTGQGRQKMVSRLIKGGKQHEKITPVVLTIQGHFGGGSRRGESKNVKKTKGGVRQF